MTRMRARIATPFAVLVLVGAVAIGGCGSNDASTPVACLGGSQAYLQALRSSVPGAVTLSDGTPISGCLVESQAAGELATVGKKMLGAATTLNSEAGVEPGRATTLQLGYLIGAAQRAAARNEGIDAELIRRLTAAALYSPNGRPMPPIFMRTYRKGVRAGEAQG